jgi:hypothetical protein
MPIQIHGGNVTISQPMSIGFPVASGGGGPDTNLAFNNSNSGGYWFVFGTTIYESFNSDSTITSNGDFGGGSNDWYTGTPTGSNFEIRFTYTAGFSDGATSMQVGPSGSLSTLTPTGPSSVSSWYNLGSNILLQSTRISGTYSTDDVTVRIRQVSVPSNFIEQIFTIEWAF